MQTFRIHTIHLVAAIVCTTRQETTIMFSIDNSFKPDVTETEVKMEPRCTKHLVDASRLKKTRRNSGLPVQIKSKKRRSEEKLKKVSPLKIIQRNSGLTWQIKSEERRSKKKLKEAPTRPCDSPPSPEPGITTLHKIPQAQLHEASTSTNIQPMPQYERAKSSRIVIRSVEKLHPIPMLPILVTTFDNNAVKYARMAAPILPPTTTEASVNQMDEMDEMDKIDDMDEMDSFVDEMLKNDDQLEECVLAFANCEEDEA